MAKATEESLSELHGMVAEVLLGQLRGEPNSSTLKLAIEFLHKNNITADLGDSKNARLRELQAQVTQEARKDAEEDVEPDTITNDDLRNRFRVVG